MSPPVVRLDGPRREASAFSVINRQWHAILSQRSLVRLAADADHDADVSIHHDFSIRFGDRLTTGRRRVAVRPWDFGPYPARWVDVIARHYDELWVHSAWSRRCAIDAGVPPERVSRIPLGIDPSVMHPDGPAASLDLDDRRVLLFVGAAVARKGIDLLLTAYRRAFTAADRVALVVKDHTGDVFYGGQSHAAALQDAARDSTGARVVYLDAYLPVEQLAALYRRADAFVLPYRAEGFACPVLEAMACGVPAVIPAFGACLDYCDPSTGILVPTREVRLPVGRSMETNSLGFEEVVERVHFCETPVDRLADALRQVVEMPDAARRALGQAAAARARQWTWDASADAVVDRIRHLA